MQKLKDTAQIRFAAGKGGDGAKHFGPFKKPDGGMGGNGGNVYIKGTTHLYDLSYIKRDSLVKAGDGERGGKNNLTGKNGNDIVFKVPLITKIYDEEGNLVLTVDKPGVKHLLLKGGTGGLGNYYFRSGQQFTLDKTTPGKAGEVLNARLELNLKADIIFIGLPNAGKSSIVNELTAADSKVAHYAFTTLDPVLGNMDGIVLMDLPGLIEGTFSGRGLGTRFKKHAETAQVLAHFVSLESDDVVRDYEIMRKEIQHISDKLFNLPEIIVLTKSDLVSKEKQDQAVKALKKYEREIIVTSAYDYDSLEALKEKFRKSVKAN